MLTTKLIKNLNRANMFIMKYLYYLFVLFTVILRRLIFPLIFLAIPFRKYLNNTVFNYHIQNNIKLKRLEERTPKRVYGGWELANRHSGTSGFIKNNPTSSIKYYLALPFWLLLDADCNEDTYDKGFNETIISKQRKAWMPNFIVKCLIKDVVKADESNLIGNTFDLGDRRAEKPLSGFWSIFWWTLRNPAYNFNYKFNQIPKNGKEFQIQMFGRLFGWKEDGVINGTQYYSWEFLKKV